MVNCKLLWLLCIVWSVTSFGQAVSPEALVPAGQTDHIQQYSLSWTLGQVANATLLSSDRMLTEGFQQPNLFIEAIPMPDVAIKPAAAADLDCTIYPNPSSDRVNVRVHQSTAQRGFISLLDGNGKLLRRESVELQDYNDEWEVSRLASGNYLFQLSTEEGVLLRTFRLTKL